MKMRMQHQTLCRYGAERQVHRRKRTVQTIGRKATQCSTRVKIKIWLDRESLFHQYHHLAITCHSEERITLLLFVHNKQPIMVCCWLLLSDEQHRTGPEQCPARSRTLAKGRPLLHRQGNFNHHHHLNKQGKKQKRKRQWSKRERMYKPYHHIIMYCLHERPPPPPSPLHYQQG